MSQLTLNQIKKSFGSTEVIKGIDLTIHDGEFVVFVGPSGCGKSTLLRMICGLEAITEGELLIDGELVNDLSPKDRGIGMVFQSYALYPHMSVYENMAFGLQVRGISKQQADERIRKAAEMLKLTNLLERKPKQLSGGQRQRVAIGRALVRQPKVFLLDEPLSNLDAALRVHMRMELAELHRQQHCTMVYVTHDQVEAMTLADKIVVLNQGHIEQVGTPLELYNTPANRFVASFIGSPKMNILPLVGDGDLARLALPQCYGQAAELGVRPEHLEIIDSESGNALLAEVKHQEQLGSETLVYLQLGHGLTLTVKSEGQQRFTAGEQCWVRFPLESVHLFDAKGERINIPSSIQHVA